MNKTIEEIATEQAHSIQTLSEHNVTLKVGLTNLANATAAFFGEAFHANSTARALVGVELEKTKELLANRD